VPASVIGCGAMGNVVSDEVMLRFSDMRLREFISSHRSRIALIVRYGIAGGIGAFVQTGALYVWVSLLSLEEHYLWGAVVAFVVALVITFLLQKFWTFKSVTKGQTRRQFSLYGVIGVCSLILNLSLLHVAKFLVEGAGFDFFRIWYLVAQVGIVGTIACLTFLANYFLTFRTSHKNKEIR
jgi:putative flippase GtrA